ncbi:DUF3152 domain-containing protein [Streptomyces sp. QL37]|uniref:DUF3152 domain-containing protein n=1 Tax=Streptomyces sp. QL37 TaxID=2093747 RepID=UPI000CF26C34|nr:DUF3152 domain-containing protein [Streptomyces sp. QL37]PPQ59055.1 hypothetical protein C5F59_22175 [Streptomyces sp. QL37]
MHSDDTHRIRSAAGSRRGAGAPAPGSRPSRTQARKRSAALRKRTRRRRAVLAAAVVAVAAAATFLYVDPPWQDDGAAVAADRTTSPPATTAPEASASPKALVSPEASKSPPPPSPSAEESVDPDSVPKSGPGTFTVAGEGVSSGGGGSRYRVEVEDGIGVDPDSAAEDVAEILADPRGWSKGGTRTFTQVDDDSAGLVIKIGTARTTDRLCGQYGLNTGGEVNCRGGKNVMVNLDRWQLGSPTFDGPATEYRALIINHEVGHWLGHGHETCPGPGEPAPAMMQQIKGLKGCTSNAWPYDGNGRYLGGPSVP